MDQLQNGLPAALDTYFISTREGEAVPSLRVFKARYDRRDYNPV